MCGIAGYFGFRQIEPEVINRCLRLMERRGPDDATHRHWINPNKRNVYLLHSRLSLIDRHERSHKPFGIGTKWLAVDGVLYNYLELRSQLAAQGHTFATESDTEVFLRALDCLGWQAWDRCEGMWATAMYDEANGTLTFSRDRFGEKPLYLYREASGLYFGSEVKFIVALLGHRLDLNLEHFYRYMVNGYRSLYKGSHTFYYGLTELPPASTLRVDARGREELGSYWRPSYSPQEGMTYEQAVSGVRERVIHSVELRLRADVPLAFCTTTGIASNSLIGVARNIFNYDVHGFTIVSPEAHHEEKIMTDRAVAELGMRHSALRAETSGFLAKLRTLIRQHDGPVHTVTDYARWLLMEGIADQGYRVSLSGTAANELFAGYHDHHLAYLFEIRNDAALHTASRQAWKEHIRPGVRNPCLVDPDLFINDPANRKFVYLNADEFSRYLRDQWHEPFVEKHYTADLLRNRMMNEMFHETVPVFLHEDDLNAMYFSIENRTPMLDRNLFEFCCTIPTRYLIREGRGKAVLRDAMAGIVPQPILENRRELGFDVPLNSFLQVRNPEIRSYLLDHSPIFDHVRRDRMEGLIAKPELTHSESKFLFSFLNCKLFLEEIVR